MSKDDDYTRVLVELTGVLGAPAEPIRNSFEPFTPERINVGAIRRKTGLSQPAFASRIGVRASTVRNWEQGHRTPQGPARVLLALLERNPRIAEEVLGSSSLRSTRRVRAA